MYAARLHDDAASPPPPGPGRQSALVIWTFDYRRNAHKARLLSPPDCTVIVAHKSSTNIPPLARLAAIVVVAAGVPGLVKADWIKPGATVIDVGISRVPAPEKGLQEDGSVKTKIVGDVDFAQRAPRRRRDHSRAGRSGADDHTPASRHTLSACPYSARHRRFPHLKTASIEEDQHARMNRFVLTVKCKVDPAA